MSYFYHTDRLGREIPYQGKNYLHFSGTAYLGMVSLPDFERLVCKGIRKHGPNHGSSRNSNVQLPIYSEFEDQFATEAGAADAMVLSNGYLAGQLAVQTMIKEADLIWAAPDAHPAILFSSQNHKTPSGMDFKNWASLCKERAESLMGQKILFLCNAVNPLQPEIHEFEWIKSLPTTNQYSLLVDDSHAFGVLGKSLYGTYNKLKHLPVALMVCGSLGKALSLPAGIILGEPSLLEKARANPIYRSSSPPAPAFLEAFISGQSLYLDQRERLLNHIHWINKNLNNLHHFKTLDNYPVVSFDHDSWVENLHDNHIIISSFPYPHQEDPLVNRIILSAYHTKEDLIYLVHQLNQLAP